MRITDLATTAPIAMRPDGTRRGDSTAAVHVLGSAPRDADHPDAIAASALARAAGQAQAGRLVAAANQGAALSVLGDRLDLALAP